MTTNPHNTLLICPLTNPDVGAMRSQMNALAGKADAVECRLDFLTEVPTDEQLRHLLADPPLPVIVTHRPSRQGGRFTGDETSRLELLARTAEFSPMAIDIEMDVPAAGVPDAKTILSHHDFIHLPDDLDKIAAAQDASPAAVNKIVFTPAGPHEALRALDILRACKKPTIALAMGDEGLLTRILAKKFGAYGTFAAIANADESAPGQPTIDEFKNLYRWDAIDTQTMLCGVIGFPVGHSMSPAIHNAAFRATSLNAIYLPLLIHPAADDFNRFMDALMDRPWMDFRGLSVTIPHKEHALAYVGAENCDELSVKIGAINTITISPDGKLQGRNNDYSAAIDTLCEAMGITRDALADKSVAVLGAGGAARAIVAALAHYQARTTIYNRTLSRAEKLAEQFNATAEPIGKADNLDAEIVINCTPIGMYPNIDASPIAKIPAPVKVVFDTIYNPIQTQLLQLADQAGCVTVGGLQMFVNQAAAQFETWTDQQAPREIMRDAVIKKLTT